MRQFLNARGVAMLLLGICLAFGFTVSAQSVSRALVRMRQANTIRVKGFAEQEITSDLASWTCRITARSKGLPDAYNRLEAARNATAEYLRKQGVAETEIDFLPVDTDTAYARDEKGKKTNTIEFYLLTQSIRVSTGRVDIVDKVSKSVTELIKRDIEIESFSPSYLVSDINEIKLDLLAKATENARSRAEILAANSHGRVGSLCSASQGVFQITPLHSTDVSSYGRYDTSTIQKNIRAVVTLQFAIDR